MDKLKIVKFIVFILTFLLFLGAVTAGVMVFKKTTQKPRLTDIILAQPTGSTIKGLQINDEKIYLLIKGGQTADRIVIIDQDSGQVAATIKTY